MDGVLAKLYNYSSTKTILGDNLLTPTNKALTIENWPAFDVSYSGLLEYASHNQFYQNILLLPPLSDPL